MSPARRRAARPAEYDAFAASQIRDLRRKILDGAAVPAARLAAARQAAVKAAEAEVDRCAAAEAYTAASARASAEAARMFSAGWDAVTWHRYRDAATAREAAAAAYETALAASGVASLRAWRATAGGAP